MSTDHHVYPAQQVADYFLLRAQEDGEEPMTNLRLQKLLYYAQAWTLALTDAPLIDEEVQAWVHGPAVPSIYRKYKRSRWERIPSPTSPSPVFDPGTRRVLDAVWEAYGHLSARKLRDMTHREPPWRNARCGFEADETCAEPISHDDMRDYFSGLLDQQRAHELDRERTAFAELLETAEEREIAELSLELLAAGR